MDYFDILKRGLKIAWAHKRLWVLGFFVAGAASAPNPYSQTLFTSGNQQESAAQMESFARWVEANVGLVAALAGLLTVVGLVMFVLSIAAHGGLVWATNEAAEGRSPRLGEAWGVGFRRWGRTFMIGLCLFGPLVVAIIALFAVLFVPFFSVVTLSSEADAAAGTGIASFLCGLPLLLLLTFVGAVVVELVFVLALRYGVLDDLGFGQAIRRAWKDVWGKRGAWAMWAVMLLPRIVYGAVVGVIGLLLLVPAAFAFYSGQVITGASAGFLAALLLAVPQAAYSTFSAASWTTFFRRISGREAAGLQAIAPAGDHAQPGARTSWQQVAEIPPPPPAVGTPPIAPPPPPAPSAPPASPEASPDDPER